MTMATKSERRAPLAEWEIDLLRANQTTGSIAPMMPLGIEEPAPPAAWLSPGCHCCGFHDTHFLLLFLPSSINRSRK